MVKFFGENQKNSERLYKDLNMYNMLDKHWEKNSPEAAKDATLVQLVNVGKNPGMLASSRFWDIFLSFLFYTNVYLHVFFTAVAIMTSKE